VQNCSASCDEADLAGIAQGQEVWETRVVVPVIGEGAPCPEKTQETKTCSLQCDLPPCGDGETTGEEETAMWTHCSRTCQQQLTEIVVDEDGSCHYQHSIRTCHLTPCPLAESATVVTVSFILTSSMMPSSINLGGDTDSSEAETLEGEEGAASEAQEQDEAVVEIAGLPMEMTYNVEESMFAVLEKLTGVGAGDMQITSAEIQPPSDGSTHARLDVSVDIYVVSPAALVQEQQSNGKDVDTASIVTVDQVKLVVLQDSFKTDFGDEFSEETGLPIFVEEVYLAGSPQEINVAKEGSTHPWGGQNKRTLLVVVVGSVVSGLVVAGVVFYALHNRTNPLQHHPLSDESDEDDDDELEMAERSGHRPLPQSDRGGDRNDLIDEEDEGV